MTTEYLSDKLDRTLLEISDADLAEKMAYVTPLYWNGSSISRFTIPDLRKTAFTWDPQDIAPVAEDEGWEEVMRTTTQHACGYHAFFKPSISEVLAQMPNDPRIVGFYIDPRTYLNVLYDGSGHAAETVWLTNKAHMAKLNGALVEAFEPAPDAAPTTSLSGTLSGMGEWLKRKILEDGDEGEIGAGMMAYAFDPERIVAATKAGKDYREGFEEFFKDAAA